MSLAGREKKGRDIKVKDSGKKGKARFNAIEDTKKKKKVKRKMKDEVTER